MARSGGRPLARVSGDQLGRRCPAPYFLMFFSLTSTWKWKPEPAKPSRNRRRGHLGRREAVPGDVLDGPARRPARGGPLVGPEGRRAGRRSASRSCRVSGQRSAGAAMPRTVDLSGRRAQAVGRVHGPVDPLLRHRVRRAELLGEQADPQLLAASSAPRARPARTRRAGRSPASHARVLLLDRLRPGPSARGPGRARRRAASSRRSDRAQVAQQVAQPSAPVAVTKPGCTSRASCARTSSDRRQRRGQPCSAPARRLDLAGRARTLRHRDARRRTSCRGSSRADGVPQPRRSRRRPTAARRPADQQRRPRRSRSRRAARARGRAGCGRAPAWSGCRAGRRRP